MHPCIYKEFERICSQRNITGSVLEIGALPAAGSLLCMQSLAGASEKTGINLDGPHQFRDFTIHKGNANAMTEFADGRFDVVLCNAMLEHDPRFWLTVAEIHRVTKPGGLIVIGIPGFRRYALDRVKNVLRRTPVLRALGRHRWLNLFFTATITYEVHDHPGDYYRFSPQAFREVLLAGLEDVEVHSVMLPPRIIGVGIKPRIGESHG